MAAERLGLAVRLYGLDGDLDSGTIRTADGHYETAVGLSSPAVIKQNKQTNEQVIRKKYRAQSNASIVSLFHRNGTAGCGPLHSDCAVPHHDAWAYGPLQAAAPAGNSITRGGSVDPT